MYKCNANNYIISNLIYIQVFWFQTEGYPIFVLNESQIADDRFELGRSNDDDWGLQIHDTEWDAGTYSSMSSKHETSPDENSASYCTK